jgi:hypothetical protein
LQDRPSETGLNAEDSLMAKSRKIVTVVAAAVVTCGGVLSSFGQPTVASAATTNNSSWGRCTPSQTGEKTVDYLGTDLNVHYAYAPNCGVFHITSMTPGCGGALFTCGEHSQGVIGSDYSSNQTAWYNQNVTYYNGSGSDARFCRVFLRGAPGANPNVTGWCTGR